MVDHDADSELLCELFAVLENHNVDEGLRDTIMGMVARWEMENDDAGPTGRLIEPLDATHE